MFRIYCQYINSIWVSWLSQPCRWIPTLTVFPVIYGLEFIIGRIVRQVVNGAPMVSHDLLGKAISYSIFILILPSWLKIRWGEKQPWNRLGLSSSPHLKSLSYFLIGISIAAALLLKICLVGMGGGWAYWIGNDELTKLINVFVLCICIGLGEELIFRGWLWGELVLIIGPQRSLPAQAIIFSLFYFRFNIPALWIFGLIAGRFLLGIALAFRRRQNQGSLWGCVGLHGGLVGGWYALQSGILDWSPTTPLWLIGPQNNPIAGLAGISALCVLIFFQLIALSRSARTSH